MLAIICVMIMIRRNLCYGDNDADQEDLDSMAELGNQRCHWEEEGVSWSMMLQRVAG